MVDIPQTIKDLVNNPKRIGILCTVDADGKPNAAYFGSPRFRDGTLLSMGLMGGRTLTNLKANPNAVFFCVEKSPVGFMTPGCRLYLEVDKIHTEGEFLAQIKSDIEKGVNADAANAVTAAVSFNVTEIRNLLDM